MLKKPHAYDSVVYLMQGGGALGSYQVGVSAGLIEHGVTPDWLIGVSIGSINAAILAGNEPAHCVSQLKSFWKTIASPLPPIPKTSHDTTLQAVEKGISSLWTMLVGQPDFFKPRLINPWIEIGRHPDKISFYDTSQLKDTLLKYIDFDLINQKKTRLTLSAYCIEEGCIVYFDNTKQTITPEHVMASGALPPGFPAVCIDGKNYWDGGICSNTPMNAILADDLQETLLCISMHLFTPHDQVPTNMTQILKLKKEVEYASRYHEALQYLYEIKRLHHALYRLSRVIPDLKQKATEEEMVKLSKMLQPVILKIVRFHYQDDPTNLWTKDFEFSPQSLEEHYNNGYRDAKKALEDPTWLQTMPEHGVAMYDF